LAEGRAESEQLRAQIAQKNTDLTRLRGQRDEKEAELLERRTKEGEKMRYAEEVEVLAKTRAERIVWLESEIKRLKGRLGAESGSAGYLAFLRSDGGVDGDYVKNLEAKLSYVYLDLFLTSC
jgi:E3 ubiquitin-protein ligase BRE1